MAIQLSAVAGGEDSGFTYRVVRGQVVQGMPQLFVVKGNVLTDRKRGSAVINPKSKKMHGGIFPV
jgi:hypothetical protein